MFCHQSQRDCVLLPNVAATRLRWVFVVNASQPGTGCAPLGHNAVGVDDLMERLLPKVAAARQPWAFEPKLRWSFPRVAAGGAGPVGIGGAQGGTGHWHR